MVSEVWVHVGRGGHFWGDGKVCLGTDWTPRRDVTLGREGGKMYIMM